MTGVWEIAIMDMLELSVLVCFDARLCVIFISYSY